MSAAGLFKFENLVWPLLSNQEEKATSNPPAPGPTVEPAFGTFALPHSYSRTEKNCVKLCHRWTIGNFSFFLNEGFVLSPPFTADKNDEIHWCLGLCPKGCDDDSKGHISLALCLSSSKERDVLVKYNFSLLNTKNEAVLLDSMDEPVKLKQGENWGSKKLIRRDWLTKLKLLHDDELSVYCELWYATDTVRLLGTKPL